jgi:SAM-dependent methyltransferase
VDSDTFQSALGTRFQAKPPASNDGEVRERHSANREAWNEGAEGYTRNLEPTLADLRARKSSLHPIERANLGNLRDWCHTAIHLQCASGEDTLSLWLEGAQQVVGVDISDVHIQNAEYLSNALDAPAQWYCCDILDTPEQLNGSADLVYTGQGALCWLHDLDGWAAVIARLLKPGGMLHLLDDHPITWLFEMDANSLVASGLDYFHHTEVSQSWAASYLGDLGRPVEQHAKKYERLWPIADVFQALRRAGLQIEQFGEHSEQYWDNFPNLPAELRARIPNTFSLVARR